MDTNGLRCRSGLMSALGQKRTFRSAIVMSALPPKADIESYGWECPLCAKSGHRNLQTKQT